MQHCNTCLCHLHTIHNSVSVRFLFGFCSLLFAFRQFSYHFSVRLLFGFSHLWHCNLQDEVICSERRDLGTIGLLFPTDTIHTLAEFLHVVIGFQEGGNFRITREVSVADVAGLHLTRQLARRLKYQSIIEHLDLYLCSFDVVGSVATGINHHLLYDEFWIVTTGDELSECTAECTAEPTPLCTF